MKYKVIRNPKYDFIGQHYATNYPNLHKYPATMIPQIGIELFKELKISNCKLLDPYCGSGSSFTIGMNCGINEMWGFDINPLAVLISKAKFTKIDLNKMKSYKQKLRNEVYEFIKKEENFDKIQIPDFYNIHFWFSKNVLQNLSIIKFFINKIANKDIKRIFLIPFSETIRECSYTRNNEFKLYKMKSEDILNFNPDVFGIYFNKLNKTIFLYEKYYFPKLDSAKINIDYKKFETKENYFDVVLTSPPYGDSKTTVAYGQFSLFSNEWLGIENARKIDSLMMGGKISNSLYNKGLISNYINEINKKSYKRSLEVSSYYYDLEDSIFNVAKSVKKNGKIIYVVGNRRVKNIQLPTDQFIAEKFEQNGFKHLFTYERLLGNKSMPLENSPTNKKGQRCGTMTKEYIVVCEK
ncbi:MAG: modification methylase [Candidatus Aenigmarchaeota archaeon ex4484_52]|nr:MAG: modification methylase [Candidatus Aenigmarchaeota archaeon ex4484_52]